VRKHPNRRPIRLVAVATAVLTFAGLSLVGSHAYATEAPATEAGRGHFVLPPGAPTPGEGFRILAAYRVKPGGTQTYTCTEAGEFGTASIPDAVLKRYGGRSRIEHFAGPRWRAADGSTLLGAVVERVEQEGTIPWLLLSVTHEVSPPGGKLNDVTHISRVNTTGGLRPTGACTPGETRAVPYGADYVFWVPQD
jgi:hypothetical protein